MAAAAAPPCYARVSRINCCGSTTFFVHINCRRRYIKNTDVMSNLSLLHRPLSSFTASSSQRCKSATIKYMHNGDEQKDDPKKPKEELDSTRNQKRQIPNLIDTILEIPDPKLLAGDLLFLLIINFLLQIASEVSTSKFWLNGGFLHQSITLPTSLLGVVVRDSKMSIAWTLSALWNRSFSSSSVSDDQTAIKVAIQVWVDYCSLRVLLELGESIGFTHSTINILSLGMEVWYTVVIMAFFRLAYSRMNILR